MDNKQKVWLDQGYDESAAGMGDIVRDRIDNEFRWVLRSAKRHKTHWTLLGTHPTHWSIDSFPGFECWEYDPRILDDEKSMKCIVDSGNATNRLSCGQLMPDRCDAQRAKVMILSEAIHAEFVS